MTLAPMCARAGLAALLLAAAPGRAAEAPAAVETPGRAQLQVCRSWVVMRTCSDYSRVDIPPRVAVGDTLYLAFGSNNKSMSFAIAAIRLADGVCTLYTAPPESDTDESEVDKLTVTPCKAAG
jgi:hypothetical protein